MREHSDHRGQCEILHEKGDIESMRIHASSPVWEIPYGYPRKSHRQSRSDNPKCLDEYEIENYIYHQSNSENLDSFLYASDSGKDLKIDLEEEITNDEKSRIL